MRSVEVVETHSSGYAVGPPWLFKGSALYQLHLVKADVARALIPKELKLVQAFGYTLGGFFLAQYDDSPAGIFDELVVIAGIVWNRPTSCAWAAKVVVNNPEACKHGRKEVGLPSHVAVFSKRTSKIPDKPITKRVGFLNMLGITPDYSKPRELTEVQVSEVDGSPQLSLCNINLPFVVPNSYSNSKWMGPMIRMSLPSFSGQTIHYPSLLKYSCQIECRVKAVEPAKISGPTDDFDDGPDGNSNSAEDWQRSISVLLSKPVLALQFNFLKMQVEAPVILAPRLKKDRSGMNELIREVGESHLKGKYCFR